MSGEELTIEQLAATAGMSVRNIRAHVTRGLLPAPMLRGRTGFYDDQHVHRLAMITRLQERGFNLAAIARLLEMAPDPDLTVELYQQAMTPWLPEQPIEMSTVELAEMFGEQPDQTRVARLRRAGVLEVIDDDHVRILNPALVRVGVRGLDLGFEVDDLMNVLAELMNHARSVAAILVQWFLASQWQPYIDAGRPTDRLPELERILEGVQPMAAEGVVAAFQQAMTEAVDVAFEGIAAEEIAAAGKPSGASAPATG